MCQPGAGHLRFLSRAGVLILGLTVLSFGVHPVRAGDDPGSGVSWGEDGSRGRDRSRGNKKEPGRRSLETRIASHEGVFTLHDAAASAESGEEFIGYLAFWDDFETDTLFLYGRLLLDRLDVGWALENLQRDLSVELVTFRAKNFMLDGALSEAAVEIPDATEWHLATRNLIRELVECSGPSVGPDDSPGISCVRWPCMATAPPSPPPPVSPKPPGSRGLHEPQAELVPKATLWRCYVADESPGIACSCGGGGGGPPPCSCSSDADCNDGNECTVGECALCVCTFWPTSSSSCERDGNPCTKGWCDIGTCLNERPTPGAPCADDGKACTSDVCDGTGACVHPPNDDLCDDGNACTFDWCDWVTGACLNPVNSGPCDDEDLCTEDDVCSGGVCAGVDVVCPGTQLCDPADGGCKDCLTDDDCNGGDPCMENVACSGGVCSGTPMDCDDNNVCTFADCLGGVCVNDPMSGGACDDEDLCTMNDTCVGGQCEGTPIKCHDSDLCTDDACEHGICFFTFNGNPGCGSGGPCAGGCDDGNQCTVDSCDDNTCTHTTHSGSCKDGDACTTNDACSAGACVGTPMDCDDGDPCTNDWCSPGKGGPCNHASLCEKGECCAPPCVACEDNGALSGGSIDVDPDSACIGDTITFTASGVVDNGGIIRVDCVMKTEIPAVTPTYTWTITRPVPLTPTTGSGSEATVSANLPGTYSCTFTARADHRECPPDSRTIAPATGTAATSATLTVDPSSIPATTDWPEMPDYSYSEVTVTWDPPECEGTLEVVDLGLTDGYQPPSDGTLQRMSATVWRYTAFDEPQNEIHSETVRVSIGAIKGGVELDREEVQVFSVHHWWTTPPNTGPTGSFMPPTLRTTRMITTSLAGNTPPSWRPLVACFPVSKSAPIIVLVVCWALASLPVLIVIVRSSARPRSIGPRTGMRVP